MIVIDTLMPDRMASREVIITDAIEQDWTSRFGVDSLGDADPADLRNIFTMFSNSDQHAPPDSTKLTTPDGSITLTREELGAEVYDALRGMSADDEINLDPTYSQVGFKIRVLGSVASDAYRLWESQQSADGSRLEVPVNLDEITARAVTIVDVVLQPPSLA